MLPHFLVFLKQAKGKRVKKMKVILVYDVEQPRVARINKLLKKFLVWVQRSVFYGVIQKETLSELIDQLDTLIFNERDHVVIFIFDENVKMEEIHLGKNKEDDFII